LGGLFNNQSLKNKIHSQHYGICQVDMKSEMRKGYCEFGYTTTVFLGSGYISYTWALHICVFRNLRLSYTLIYMIINYRFQEE